MTVTSSFFRLFDVFLLLKRRVRFCVWWRRLQEGSRAIFRGGAENAAAGASWRRCHWIPVAAVRNGIEVMMSYARKEPSRVDTKLREWLIELKLIRKYVTMRRMY